MARQALLPTEKTIRQSELLFIRALIRVIHEKIQGYTASDFKRGGHSERGAKPEQSRLDLEPIPERKRSTIPVLTPRPPRST